MKEGHTIPLTPGTSTNEGQKKVHNAPQAPSDGRGSTTIRVPSGAKGKTAK